MPSNAKSSEESLDQFNRMHSGEFDIMMSYNLYKDNDIVTFIKLRILEWAGRVYRLEDHRIHKRFMEGGIYGIRPKGRPENRWIDSVTVDARDLLGNSAWRRVAKDRDEWRKKIEEAKARLRAVVT